MRLTRRFCTQQTPHNYYRILGVSNTAPANEIKAKYKDLVKKYHPDVYKGNDKDLYKKIQEAYKTLISPKKRMEYDETLSKGPSNKNATKTPGSDPDSKSWDDLADEYKANTSADEFYKDFNTVGPKSEAKIDEEYKKFFKEKVKTNFGDMVVQEDEAISKFTKKDRARAVFAEKFNEKNLAKKYIDSQGVGYDKTLEENIEVLNNNTKEKKKLRILAMMDKYGIVMGGFKVFGVGLGLAFLIVCSIYFNNVMKLKKIEEIVKKREAENEIESKSSDLKGKMVFD